MENKSSSTGNTNSLDVNAPNPTNSSSASTKSKDQLAPVKFSRLFRFADKEDKMLMIVGTIAAIANGAALPSSMLLFGDMTNILAESGSSLIDQASTKALQFFYIALGAWAASYLSFSCWMITGERQAIRIRKEYFKALLRQEIGWYDALNPNELATRVSAECTDIQSGIGEKVAIFCFTIATSISGFLIGYVKGWQLALVLCGVLPIISIAGGVFVGAMQKSAQVTSQAYAEAGAIAEQAFGAIRTVQSLCGEDKEIERYKAKLGETLKKIMQFAIVIGLSMGMMMFSSNGMYAVGFYMGSYLVGDHYYNNVTGADYNVGDVLTTFFAVMIGAMSTSQVSPCIDAFANAKTAGAKAFTVIDRESLISTESTTGKKLDKVVGEITFENVEFAYPTNTERKILKGINLKIESNQKTAFVGESGCGKTTSMQLIERFYDAVSGAVKLDGHDIKDLNLKWLRENIGYVGQEPALFATSIKENMLFAKEDATDAQIYEALKRANAYEFVQGLPQKLDTFVGSSGTQLSGGQKQRLAIARAILKNPPILLLDEATSALDRKNEREIQKTLDEISEGRTTIVIAHRLSTIINSDKIIVFDNGNVVEVGKHEDLIAKKGRYYSLQAMQLVHQNANQEEPEKKVLKEIVFDEREIPNEKSDGAQRKGSLKIESTKAQLSPVVKAEIITQTERNQEEEKHLLALSSPTSKVEPAKEKLYKIEAEETEPATKVEVKPRLKRSSGQLFVRVLSFNKPEMGYLVFGCICALINGSIMPLDAIILSHVMQVLSTPDSSTFRSDANFYCLMFFILAIVNFISQAFAVFCLMYVGQALTCRIRTMTFVKYLRMHIGFFDLPENNPGTLTTKLARDAALINSITGTSMAIALQAVSSFITGMAIAFSASWYLTLVVCGIVPFMMLSAHFQAKINRGFSSFTEEAYKESGGFISEAVVNMRTVASFAREKRMLESFSEKLRVPLEHVFKKGTMSGIIYGFSNTTTFCVLALVFYVGAVFIVHEGLTFQNFFMTMFGVMFAAIGMGNVSQFMPDVGAAQNAADYVFDILDSKPEIDIDNPSQNVKTPIVGEIEFKNVTFKYPTRDRVVFTNLNFKILPSTKVAFVGSSGCGKSTCIQLLQRFYDPLEGEILIDGVNIKKYDLRHLRSSLGIVSQEPVLFNGTIEYNLKYTKEHATEQEMRAAAAEANALDFIEKNEFDAIHIEGQENVGTGFQRQVGPKGSQISGGQKQRIAIARAILKKPTILLLDEATSALDTQNEEIVQKSLNKIMAGHTSLSIAHRISTIKDSDNIMVFQEGRIVESGTYEALKKAKGVFYHMESGTN